MSTESDFLASLRVPEVSTAFEPTLLSGLRVPEEKSIPTDTGELFSGYAQNIAPSAANRVQNYWDMISSPIDTAEAVFEVGKGFKNKAERKIGEWLDDEEYDELPHKSEMGANMAIDSFLDRWGSVENAKYTLYNDPVGSMLDATGLLSAIPKVGTNLAKGVDLPAQIGRATQDALNQGKRTLPERMYAQSMNIPTSELVGKADAPTPRGLSATRAGLKESIGRTATGYEKLLNLRQSVGDQINNVIQTGMNNMQMIPTASVGKYLDGMLKDVSSGKYDIADLKAIQKMRDDFYEQFGDRPNMTPMQVQEWKKSRYDKAYAGEASPLASERINATTVGNRQLGRGAKEGIENRLPQIAGLNEQYGDLSKLKPYVQRAVNASTGDIGMMKKMLEALPTSRIAIILEKIAKGDMGEAEKFLNTPQLRTAIELAGRARTMMDEDTTLYDD